MDVVTVGFLGLFGLGISLFLYTAYGKLSKEKGAKENLDFFQGREAESDEVLFLAYPYMARLVTVVDYGKGEKESEKEKIEVSNTDVVLGKEGSFMEGVHQDDYLGKGEDGFTDFDENFQEGQEGSGGDSKEAGEAELSLSHFHAFIKDA